MPTTSLIPLASLYRKKCVSILYTGFEATTERDIFGCFYHTVVHCPSFEDADTGLALGQRLADTRSVEVVARRFVDAACCVDHTGQISLALR
jgi:hypothetical protein